ncbi:right-handed parallel beta-helix repeat-containing protein [Methylomonas sp. 2BW1-5-20]|uniref:right-handed parallel beta-helix repeat-containing protein n=1 Tax=Methylomonas sp. 2BW1-5-20 TaxID=3376686 RepID=UPI00404F7250
MNHLIKIFLAVLLCCTTETMAQNYYVNPDGNDLWSGTAKTPNPQLNTGPFKTIERAKQAIRQLKQEHAFNEKVTVNIAGGIYYLNHPLNFNLIDSGFADREIIWQGEPGSNVTISGGIPINCEHQDTQLWRCPITTPPINTEFFDTGRIKGNAPKFQLYVNNQKMVLARWPDRDWAHIKAPFDEKSHFSSMEEIPPFTGEADNGQVHIFPGNDWFDQIIGIDSITAQESAIKLATPALYKLESGRRFYIQNLPSFLDTPSEWYYDNSTKLINFIPTDSSAPETIILSSLPSILSLDGTSYLSFRNIKFQHSTATAVTSKNSENVTLDNLEISNIDGKGIEIKGGHYVKLINSSIHHTGAHGVVVSGGDRNSLNSAEHLIHNNHIHHMGTTILTYSSGIEANGVGIRITHNLLEQGAGSAILITGNDHLIEKNEIHHFCLQAADCGAIYTG